MGEVIVFNPTFSNISAISWWSVLLVEETGVFKENHCHVASHWQTLSHNVVSSTHHHIYIYIYSTALKIFTIILKQLPLPTNLGLTAAWFINDVSPIAIAYKTSSSNICIKQYNLFNCWVGFYFIVLSHWNNIDMSPHSDTDTLSWFRVFALVP